MDGLEKKVSETQIERPGFQSFNLFVCLLAILVENFDLLKHSLSLSLSDDERWILNEFVWHRVQIGRQNK